MYIEITINIRTNRYSHDSKVNVRRKAELDLPDTSKIDMAYLSSELTREAVECYHNGGDKQDESE